MMNRAVHRCETATRHVVVIGRAAAICRAAGWIAVAWASSRVLRMNLIAALTSVAATIGWIHATAYFA